MQPTDFQRFNAVMAGMGRVFGAEIDRVILDAYWLALRDWNIAEFEAAASHLMQTSEFMPKPSAFTTLRKATQESPAEAWTKVRAAIRSMGTHDRVSIDARTDKVVAALGGYRALALTNSDEMHFREKRFAEIWAELGEVEEVREALPLLCSGNGQRKLAGPKSVAAMLSNGAGRTA